MRLLPPPLSWWRFRPRAKEEADEEEVDEDHSLEDVELPPIAELCADARGSVMWDEDANVSVRSAEDSPRVWPFEDDAADIEAAREDDVFAD